MMPHLLATFRLANFNPPWLWLGLAVIAVVIVVLSYRVMHRRSGSKLAWGLMGLRLVAVAALWIALVKPIWQRTVVTHDKPQVAVMVDDSQSMGLAATSEQSGAEDPANDEAEAHHEAQGQPGRSRYRVVRDWLDKSPAAKALKQRFDVTLFDGQGRVLDDGQLADQPTGQRTDLNHGLRVVESALRGRHPAATLLVSDGQDTSGRSSFLDLRDYTTPVYGLGFNQPPPQRLGVDLAVDSVDAPAEVIVHNQVPVKLELSRTGQRGHNHGETSNGDDGGGALTRTVRIERGGKVLATKQVTFDKGAEHQTLTVAFTPTRAGRFVLTARLRALSGERNQMNNTKLFDLRVKDKPIRVLYIEGTLRPEFTFLRNRLNDDPDVDLVSFVRSASSAKAAPHAAHLSVSQRVSKQLLTKDRLKKIDVVLLGDFESSMLDQAAYKRLRSWLDQGGGLAVLGGYLNLSSQGLGQTKLGEALPVGNTNANHPDSGDNADSGNGTDSGDNAGDEGNANAGDNRNSDDALAESIGAGQINEPFQLQVTREGRGHPLLAVTGNPQRDADLWQSMPALAGLTAVKNLRPGASVLLRDPRARYVPQSSSSSNGNPGPVKTVGYPVLAVQPYGQGVSSVLTIGSTWRWSRLARMQGKPDTMYVRFWSQFVRYLAQRPMDDQPTALTVSSDHASYDRGDKVRLRVHRNPAAILPGEISAEQSVANAEADGESAGESQADSKAGAKPKSESESESKSNSKSTSDSESASSAASSAKGITTPARITLSVVTPRGERIDLDPRPSADDPNTWQASYFPAHGGRFTVDAGLTTPAPQRSTSQPNSTPKSTTGTPAKGSNTSRPIGESATNAKTEFAVTGSQLELQNPGTNPTLLKQIARLTGGGYSPLSDAKTTQALLDQIPDKPRTRKRTQTAELWHTPALLIAFVVLLTLEWILRRRHGLV